MNIVCPQCGFAREVPDDKLPAASVIATCPHCQHRFRISKDGVAAQECVAASPLSPSVAPQRAPGEDDPLPPGAVIPSAHETQAAPRVEQPLPPPAAPASAPASTSSPAENGAHKPVARAEQPLSEEEKDFRRAAAAAYEKQAEEDTEEEFAVDNPWERPEKDGYPAAFYTTCVRVMFHAPRFFSGLKPDTPQRFALIFFLVVCGIQVCIDLFWGSVLASVMGPAAATDPQLQELLKVLSPPDNIVLFLLTRVAFLTMQLFAMTALYFIMFRLLAADKADYQLLFQVMAYSSAPALLCIVPVAGTVAGFIWSLASCYVGCRYALRLTWTQTALGLVPIYVLSIPIILKLAQHISIK